MSTREKKKTEVEQNDAVEAQPMTPAREQVETLRERATELLTTARNVIDDTLSSESEQYLNSVRQQGGQ